MTNQNNEFGKSPVKLSSPTQIWIDDVNQNNELNEILAKAMAHYKAEDWNGSRILTEAKQAIQAHTNAEIARLLDRLETEMPSQRTFCNEYNKALKEVSNVIQAEREKLKEVK